MDGLFREMIRFGAQNIYLIGLRIGEQGEEIDVLVHRT
jgi:hypothetical protein